MARRSPAQKLQRIRRVIEAWEGLASDSTFYGMTLEQFKAGVRPCFQFREEIDYHQACLKLLPHQRDEADNKAMELVDGVAFGVGGDPKFGLDSLLYGRLGYVRKSARRKRGKKR